LNDVPILIDKEFLEVPLVTATVVTSNPFDKPFRHTLMRVRPKSPDFSVFNHLYTSLVSSPLTSDFFIRGKLTPWLRVQKSAIPRSSAGSWPPNLKWVQDGIALLVCKEEHTWLQGKPRISRPWSLYLSYRAWRPKRKSREYMNLSLRAIRLSGCTFVLGRETTLDRKCQ